MLLFYKLNWRTENQCSWTTIDLYSVAPLNLQDWVQNRETESRVQHQTTAEIQQWGTQQAGFNADNLNGCIEKQIARLLLKKQKNERNLCKPEIAVCARLLKNKQSSLNSTRIFQRRYKSTPIARKFVLHPQLIQESASPWDPTKRLKIYHEFQKFEKP